MKNVIIVLLCLDALLVAGAGVRFLTATPETKPLIAIVPMEEDEAPPPRRAAAPEEKAGIGETGAGGALVEHMQSSKRIDEVGQTGEISTTSPHGNADLNATSAVEKAESIEAGREEDLDDAKAKIGQIGK